MKSKLKIAKCYLSISLQTKKSYQKNDMHLLIVNAHMSFFDSFISFSDHVFLRIDVADDYLF